MSDIGSDKPGTGVRVLLVDDSRIEADVFVEGLESMGFTVHVSEDAEGAFAELLARPYDVLLTDLLMPGTDGFELCRTIRRTSDVPVVMVTARNDTHDIVAGLEAGADDYLTKPFAAKELSARIRALLRRVRPVSPAHARLVFGDEAVRDTDRKALADRLRAAVESRFQPMVPPGHSRGLPDEEACLTSRTSTASS